jgi:hypothetical protein
VRSDVTASATSLAVIMEQEQTIMALCKTQRGILSLPSHSPSYRRKPVSSARSAN